MITRKQRSTTRYANSFHPWQVLAMHEARKAGTTIIHMPTAYGKTLLQEQLMGHVNRPRIKTDCSVLTKGFDKPKWEDSIPSDCVFKNGTPTQPGMWDEFKRMAANLTSGKNTEYEVSIIMIEECFNPIIRPLFGHIVSSSSQQFESFCKLNGLIFVRMDHARSYLVRRK